MLRTDVANVYGARAAARTCSASSSPDAVEQALRLDAACVVVNLLQLPDQPELLRQCVRNVSALRAACDTVGMPLMVEPLVMQRSERGYGVDGDVEKIVPLVRQAVELGADVIKADPTDDIADYHRVIEIAGNVPVLVRGGGRASDEEILRADRGGDGPGRRRHRLRPQRHPARRPGRDDRALMAIVHDGVPRPGARSPHG